MIRRRNQTRRQAPRDAESGRPFLFTPNDDDVQKLERVAVLKGETKDALLKRIIDREYLRVLELEAIKAEGRPTAANIDAAAFAIDDSVFGIDWKGIDDWCDSYAAGINRALKELRKG